MSRFVLTAQLQLQAPTNVAQVVRQIQSQLNNVNVNVQVQNSSQAARQIQQVAQSCNQATSAADRMGRAFAVSVRRFAAFSIATRAVGLFTSTLSDAVKTAIDFERQLIKVSQVTGESIGKLRGLTQSITNLSTGLGVSSQSLLEVSTILLQAGVSAKDTEVALKSLAKAALAPNFDSITETAEGAIAILAQFKQGVGALEGQLSSINAVAGAFAVEAGDLIDVIRRTGGVFKSSGGSLNELLALFTSVRATTRESAESIGTGLRTIFTRIQRPKTIEFLKQFGVELVDLNGKFVGPFEAVKRLSEALAGLGEGDITFIRIAEELGGFRQIGKVLPLIQQFSTAQAALNVAQNAGNGLTKDAATAQQALAIRILKVREEFLALIRSVTETSTFQVFANTALSLASAFIKVADSIKPLLPLLAAITAVKLVKGIGGFLGGFGAGLGSSRTFNKGGRVYGFARGGLVPGSGNRDTVPAMLSPGEFVIKKSSVSKLGADTLSAMNENRFQNGVKVTAKNIRSTEAFTGTDVVAKRKGTEGAVIGTLQKSKSEALKQADQNIFGAAFLRPGAGTTFDGINKTDFAAEFGPKIEAGKSILRSIYGNAKDPSYQRASKEFSNIITSYQNKNKYKLVTGSLSDTVSENVENDILDGITSGAARGLSKLTQQTGMKGGVNLTETLKKANIDQTIGNIFEYMIGSAGIPYSDKTRDTANAPYDFPAGIGGLASNFGNLSNAQASPTDAKTSYTADSLSSFIKKTENYNILEAKKELGKIVSDTLNTLQGTQISNVSAENLKAFTGAKSGAEALTRLGFAKKASGGGVGTDTVPALLTPGEFVVNRSSAQNIGYGNLNRMNKIGKYAKGGVVQKFAAGTTGTGATPIVGKAGFAIPGFDVKAPTLLNKALAKLTGTFTLIDAVLAGTRDEMYSLTVLTPQLAQAIKSNANAQNLTAKQEAQLTNAYSQVVRKLVQQGVTDDQLIQRTQTYVDALNADTNAKLNSAKATVAATAATMTSPVATATTTNPFASMGGTMGAAARGQAANPFASMGGTMGAAARGGGGGGGGGGSGAQAQAALTNATNQNAQAQRTAAQSALEAASNNKMFATSMAVSLIQGFLPAVDDNSSALLRATHNLLSLATTITTVGFALEAFGVKLSGSRIMNFLQGGGLGGKGKNILARGAGNVGNTLSKAGNALSGSKSSIVKGVGSLLSKGGGAIAGNAKGIATTVNSISKLAGPAIAASLAFQALTSIVNSTTNYQARLNKAIEKGDVAQAKSLAAEKAGADAVDNVLTAFAASGAAFGGVGAIVTTVIAGFTKLASEVPVVGPAIKNVALTIAYAFGGKNLASITSMAEAAAQAAATAKDLANAQKVSEQAMEDFKNGSITAAEAFQKVATQTQSVNALTQTTNKAIAANAANKSTGNLSYGREAMAYLSFGYVDSAAERNAKIDKENAELAKKSTEAQRQAFQLNAPTRNLQLKQAAYRGMSVEDLNKSAEQGGLGDQSPEALRARASELRSKAIKALQSGDSETADIFSQQAKEFSDMANETERSFININKEVEKTRKAFDALNLGLSPVNSALSASVVALDNFVNNIQPGAITVQQSMKTLEASVTTAGKNISASEVDAALNDVTNTLSQYGLDNTQATKLKQNVTAFSTAQRESGKTFDRLKANLQLPGGIIKGTDPNTIRNEFLKANQQQLEASGVDTDTAKRITDALNAGITDEMLNELSMTGDISKFQEKLGEIGDKQLKEFSDAVQKAVQIEQQLIELTKQRIDAERNLVEAQKEALSIQLEARDIQAKYGGAPVSSDERRANLAARMNVGGGRLGLNPVNTTAAGLRQRNAEIAAGYGQYSANRQAVISGQNPNAVGMGGRAGVEQEAKAEDLKKAQKEQIENIRELIKIQEEELRIIQEKNKLEKDSLDALISGDVEKFFEQQAAVGATAAIATGNQSLMGAFGGQALGAAYSDIQRQQEAGVQELYGVRLGGAGGLVERAAQGALGARGIQDPRAAQVAARTTAEEEAKRAEIRQTAQILSETAQLAVDMAQMDLTTATMTIGQAQVTLQNVLNNGGQAPAPGAAAAAGPAAAPVAPAAARPPVGPVVPPAAAPVAPAPAAAAAAAPGGAPVVTPAAAGAGVGMFAGLDPQVINALAVSLGQFNTALAANIDRLSNINIQVTLADTRVVVDLQGGQFLAQMRDEIRNELLAEVTRQMGNMSLASTGKLEKNPGVLPA